MVDGRKRKDPPLQGKAPSGVPFLFLSRPSAPIIFPSHPSLRARPMPTIEILGLSFPISDPYFPGHVCSSAEADELNKCRSQNIRGNITHWVRAFFQEWGDEIPPQESIEALKSRVQEYDQKYSLGTFGLRNKPKKSKPLEDLIAILAEAQARQEGLFPGDDEWAERVEALIKSDFVKESAQKKLFLEQKAISEAFQDILGEDLGQDKKEKDL